MSGERMVYVVSVLTTQDGYEPRAVLASHKAAEKCAEALRKASGCCVSVVGPFPFDAASAPDPRFAQIRDLLAVWAGEGSKIGEAHAIASAAAAGEPVSPREPCALCGDSRQDPFTPGACPACAYEYERGDDG